MFLNTLDRPSAGIRSPVLVFLADNSGLLLKVYESREYLACRLRVPRRSSAVLSHRDW